MPRQGGIVNYNTFVQGLITEASPLTYPENATLREENFELRRDGSRARRFGMDFESTYDSTNTLLKSRLNSSVLMSYEWFNAGNSENENFLIVQIANILHFYDMTLNSVSSNKKLFTLDLDEYGVDSFATPIGTKDYPISVAALKGFLIVTSAAIEPIYISYNPTNGSFSTSKITIQVRDLLGVEDETKAVDHRPTALTDKHKYNLRNQGWSTTNINLTFTDLSVYPSNADISQLAKQTTYEPATAGYEIEDLGSYNPTYLQREIFGSSPAPKGHFVYDVFNREYRDVSAGASVAISSITHNGLTNIMTVTTSSAHGASVGDEILLKDIDIVANWKEEDDSGTYNESYTIPKQFNTISGRYFKVRSISAGTVFTVVWQNTIEDEGIWITREDKTYSFTTTASTVISPGTVIITGLSSNEKYRFKENAGYAGRAWYAGLDGGVYGSHVFYSQILDDPIKMGKCYQEADPTSEHISDLIDTDGGYLVIPEARNIQALIPMGQYLFIFSTNGVWRVFGDDGGNFRATAYSIEKVSDVGVNSKFSVVPVESEIYYWAIGGIYKISQQEVSGTFISANVSQLTIQTLFYAIGTDQIKFVKGSYDPTEKKISWMYNRSPVDTDTDYHYNSILIYDLILGAFYQYLLPISTNDSSPFLSGIFTLPDVNRISTVDTITANVGVDTVVVGVDTVVTTTYPNRAQTTQTKYLTIAQSDSTNYFVTFSDLNNTSFLDFEDFDSVGTDAAAYMITGYDTHGSQALKKQVHYLLMYFNRTEQSISLDGSGNMVADNPSGCLVNILWDWATDINSVRAGSQFQAYRLNRLYIPTETTDPYTYGEETIVTKNKIRGRGRSMSLAIQSEAGKDLHIYGWSLIVSGGDRP